MPFLLYVLEGATYVRVRGGIPLAGLNGPFCAAARRVPNGPEWELPETELLRFYGVDPNHYAVIIDLKPKVQNRVALYRLRHVWGFSAHGWTPLALELEGLYVDEIPPHEVSPMAFKQRFPVLSEPGIESTSSCT
jgi:hypothetical protein